MTRYHPGETNRCPSCGHRHWIIGLQTAECAFCATALPLADSRCKPAPRIVTFGKGGGAVRRMVVV